MARPLGAQLSQMLKARGVDVVFGIPGVHNQEMYRGLQEAGLTHILTRHEQGAAFMADGYARACGKPGVCFVITGPGVCNALTALGQAYSDSVPVLCLSSCLDETAMMRGQLHQMLDQQGAAASVCDWSHTARTAQAAYGLIDRAFAEFECRRPRPKSITLPIARLVAEAEHWPVAKSRYWPTEGGVCEEQMNNALDMIAGATRPMMILGGGVDSGTAGLAADVATRMGAATFTTYAGRGIIPQDAPLHFGSYLARPGSADVLAQADLVIAIGTELAEVDLWRTQLGHTCPMIRVDIDPKVLADHHNAQFSQLCDAHDWLHAMQQRDMPRASGWDPVQIAQTKANWQTEVDIERPGILPWIKALRSAIPKDTMIYSDMTQFAYAAKEVWDMDRPHHWHHPTGFGTLGYALPAAIGGAVARPSMPTLAILGDYGIQYTLAELGTAAELGGALPIIIWDNAKLGEIEASMVGAQIAPTAVVAKNPDFKLLAAAYGLGYVCPECKDLGTAMADAFACDRPTIVHLIA